MDMEAMAGNLSIPLQGLCVVQIMFMNLQDVAITRRKKRCELVFIRFTSLTFQNSLQY